MDNAVKWLEEGKKARNAGQMEEALACYTKAAEEYRDGNDLMRWAHTLRHCADLQLGLGNGMAALSDIAQVFRFYEKNEVPPLEMANTFRIGALAHEAVGEPWKAERLWVEALTLYTAENVKAGVDEATENLKRLGVL